MNHQQKQVIRAIENKNELYATFHRALLFVLNVFGLYLVSLCCRIVTFNGSICDNYTGDFLF